MVPQLVHEFHFGPFTKFFIQIVPQLFIIGRTGPTVRVMSAPYVQPMDANIMVPQVEKISEIELQVSHVCTKPNSSDHILISQLLVFSDRLH